MDTWFVLYCKPGKDTVAESNLLSQELEVYRPRVYFVQKRRDCTCSTRCESLFPRYIFIRVDPMERHLSSIGYTRGVAGFVKFGVRYSTVDDAIINDIKACELDQQGRKVRKTAFTKGDLVYINGGSFCDVKATFIEERSDNRVAVLLEILGRTSKVDVPSGYISRSSVY